MVMVHECYGYECYECYGYGCYGSHFTLLIILEMFSWARLSTGNYISTIMQVVLAQVSCSCIECATLYIWEKL